MTIISIYIFFSLQLALTIMTVISCLRFTTGSSLPTTTEELGFLKTDGNHTTWTISPLKPLRQQHQSLRTLCKRRTQAQLIKMLNELGAKSYGGYNRRYMAFTWEEANKFPNLVTTTSLWSPRDSPIPNLPLRTPTEPSTLTSAANCETTDGGVMRMCSECPTRTFLGYHKIPPFINEVTCGQFKCSGKNGGVCKNAVMHQKFYYKTGLCDEQTGYEILKPYTQEIRVCCKCMVFSF